MRVLSLTPWLVVLVVLASGAASAARQASPAQSANRARPSLFTDVQAKAGEAVYAKACASCHGANLTSGAAPALAGPAFARSWGDPRVTLDDLFFIIRTTMPPNNVTALSPTDRAAVFAHILKSNGYAAGPVALAAEMGIVWCFVFVLFFV